MSKFFDKEEQEAEVEQTEQEEQEEQKISLGDQEFTSDELQELVGKAKKVSEFEEKQGQPWEEVTKSWGQRGERIGELKKEVEELRALKEQEEKPKEQLDQEAIEKQIRQEAQKYGLVFKDELKDEASRIFTQLREGEKMMSRVKKVIRTNANQGYPKTTEKDLLEYMKDPNNPADPEKAYKLMFEDEIEKVRNKKLDSIRKPGMQTETKSTAGGKTYVPPKVSKENLTQTLRDHFRQGGEG